MRKQFTSARDFLEKELGGPLTLSMIIRAVREEEQFSQADFAKKLGISKQHLCDIEKKRRTVSVERAVTWAAILSCNETHIVQLVLQEQMDLLGLQEMNVSVTNKTKRTRDFARLGKKPRVKPSARKKKSA